MLKGRTPIRLFVLSLSGYKAILPQMNGVLLVVSGTLTHRHQSMIKWRRGWALDFGWLVRTLHLAADK